MKKLMQKRILIPILVGLAVVICIVTAVCVIVGKEGKTVNENPETDEPVSESVSEPITDPATEASVETPTESEPTEPPTEAPTEPEVPKLAINYDLLDDIGLSCTELEEKHGAITLFGTPHGGFAYKYVNGYGGYCFKPEPFEKRYVDITTPSPLYDTLPHDENGYYIPLAVEENKCEEIDLIKVSDLFINEGGIVTLDDIREIPGVEIETESEEGLPGDRFSLYSSFRVEGYNSSVVLYHDDPEFIEMDSRVEIIMDR